MKRTLLTPQANAVASYQETLREAMFDAVTEADVAAIVKGIVSKAKEGDEKSLKLLFEYILGGRQGPPQIRDSNVVINEPPNGRPTKARQGTAEKIAVMAQRHANGQAIFNGEDG